MTKSVRDIGYGRKVGNNHLKLSITQHPANGVVYDAIAFQLGHHYTLIEKNLVFDICYHIDENHYNGKVNLQLNVKDIKSV